MNSLLVRASAGVLLLLLAPHDECLAAAKAQLGFSSTGASCAGVSGMRAAVRKRLGYDPFVEEAELRVEVSIRERAGRLVGKARFERSGEALGNREMVAGLGECPGLVDSLALAISLALDPEAVDRPRLPRRPAETTSKRVGLGRLSSTVIDGPGGEASITSTGSGHLEQLAELGGWARVGSAPADAFGLSLGWSLRGADLSAALSVRARFPSESDASQVLMTTYALSLAARACLEGEGVRACAVGEAGGEHALGQGLSDEDGVWSSAAGAGVQVGAEVMTLGHWDLEAVAELMVPVIRQAYRSGEREVWRSPAVALGVGLRARWSSR